MYSIITFNVRQIYLEKNHPCSRCCRVNIITCLHSSNIIFYMKIKCVQTDDLGCKMQSGNLSIEAAASILC